MRRVALALCLACTLAHTDQSATLVFANGKKQNVRISSFDDQGVTIGTGTTTRKVPWATLTPESAFQVRKALTAAGDVAARQGLAEFARALKLFPQAMEELELVLALGGIDEGEFEKRTKEIQAEEQQHLCSRIDALLGSDQDPAACLAAIRTLKKRYPDHPNNAKYEPLVKQLAQTLAKQTKGKTAADEAALSRLEKTVAKLQAKKEAALEKAEELQRQAEAAIAKRQLARIKRTLLKPSGAEKYYKLARKHLRTIARTDTHFLVVTKTALQKEYDDLGGKLISCYLVVARALVRERNYRGAVEYVRKILLLDPLHEEAWELVRVIEKNRIHFKSSDIGTAPDRPRGDDG
jgi:tetratricopeptide (TPR) repeat protein